MLDAAQLSHKTEQPQGSRATERRFARHTGHRLSLPAALWPCNVADECCSRKSAASARCRSRHVSWWEEMKIGETRWPQTLHLLVEPSRVTCTTWVTSARQMQQFFSCRAQV